MDELVNKVRSQDVKSGTLITHSLTKSPNHKVPLVAGIMAISIFLGVVSAVTIRTTSKLSEPEKIARKEELISETPKYVQYPPEIQQAIVSAFKGSLGVVQRESIAVPQTKLEILEAELVRP